MAVHNVMHTFDSTSSNVDHQIDADLMLQSVLLVLNALDNSDKPAGYTLLTATAPQMRQLP